MCTASDEFVRMWNEDYGRYFGDVCRRTGLSLGESMQYLTFIQILHIRNASMQTAKVLTPHQPKEPWQES